MLILRHEGDRKMRFEGKRTKNNNRSIKKELILSILFLVVFAVAAVGLTTYIYKSISLMIFVSAIAVLASILTGIKLSKNIAQPITKCAERIKALSEGDLHSEVEIFENNKEIVLLTSSLNFTVKGLRDVISDITYHLGEIEKGNFTTNVELDYLGDLDAIEHSIRKIIKSLNIIMIQINESSNQVSSGAEQVASGSQALSQGATEQASSIEELAATINDISEQINKNAEKAKLASEEAGEEVINGSKQVNEMSML